MVEQGVGQDAHLVKEFTHDRPGAVLHSEGTGTIPGGWKDCWARGPSRECFLLGRRAAPPIGPRRMP